MSICLFSCLSLSFLAKRSDSETWKTGKQYCKVQGTYPKGSISLSDITRTCAETKGIGSAPHWVGVVKEMYQKEDQGNIYRAMNISRLIYTNNSINEMVIY